MCAGNRRSALPFDRGRPHRHPESDPVPAHAPVFIARNAAAALGGGVVGDDTARVLERDQMQYRLQPQDLFRTVVPKKRRKRLIDEKRLLSTVNQNACKPLSTTVLSRLSLVRRQSSVCSRRAASLRGAIDILAG
jgi:hypothetical protein